MGWGVPVTNATSGALPMDLLNNEEAASKMFGLNILLGLGLGGLIVPYVANLVAENVGYNVAMYILGAGALIGAIVSLILPKFELKD